MAKILVTGGAGFIGSHTCVELIEAGYEIVVADNLINSSEEAVRRVEKITGKKVPFVKCELCDPVEVKELFRNYPNIDASSTSPASRRWRERCKAA